MEPMKVYYYACVIDGNKIITLTDAEYFTMYDCFDGYGDSEHYEEIADAMYSCGASDFDKGFDCGCSVYRLPSGMAIESIVDAMNKKGFELINDPDFVKFCTETDIIYYCTKDDEDGLRIVVTSKAYWNRCQCVDDGTSLLGMIDFAMQKCGAWDVCEAEYMLEKGVTLEKLIENMSKIGYTMVADPDFKEFLEDWLTEED